MFGNVSLSFCEVFVKYNTNLIGVFENLKSMYYLCARIKKVNYNNFKL